jgi:membrane protein required for colicin V production
MVSYLDLFLLLPIGLAIWRGWKNGFVMEIFSTLALFVGLYAGVHLSNWMANLMRDTFGMEGDHVPITSFILVFALVCVAIFFLGKLITKNVSNGGAERWNQIGGAFFSLTKTILFLSMVFILFNIADAKYGLLSNHQKQKSYLYGPIYNFGLKIIPSFEESTFYRHLRNGEMAPLQATEKTNQEDQESKTNEKNEVKRDSKKTKTANH